MNELFHRYAQLDPYSSTFDTVHQPTFRLPYALYSPTIITHLPLFAPSQEDESYNTIVELMQRKLKADQLPIEIREPTDKNINDIIDRISKIVSSNTPGLLPLIHRPSLDPNAKPTSDIVKKIWKSAVDNLEKISTSQPELFIFRAIHLLRKELNRIVHSEQINTLRNLQEPGNKSTWTTPETVYYAPIIINAVLDEFHKPFEEHLKKIIHPNQNQDATTIFLTDDKAATILQSFKKQERYGGLIAWLQGEEFRSPRHHPSQASSPRDIHRYSTREYFKLDREFPATPAADGDNPIYDRFLLWRRGDRNWRYTFYEGSFNYSNLDQTKTSASCDVNQDLQHFLSTLLRSSSIEQSFPNPRLFEQTLSRHTAAANYGFPGTRTGGAQYFVIPAELLLLIAFSESFQSEIIEHGDPNLRDAMLAVSATLRSSSTFKLTSGLTPDAVRVLITEFRRSHKLGHTDDPDKQKSALELKNLFSDPPTTGGGVRRIALVKLWLDDLLKSVENLPGKNDKHQAREQLRTLFASSVEWLWRAIYRNADQGPGSSDFVCSSVIGGRALYFTNFRPFDLAPIHSIHDTITRQPIFHERASAAFTRTLFIDFGMSPYQRARLVRRLCEVATYRMSCIKDFSRCRAMQDGINNLNQDFSKLLEKDRGRHAREETENRYPKTLPFRLWQHSRSFSQRSRKISGALKDTIDIYSKANEFDVYLTEGVSGRRLAARSDWQRVQQQLADLRERRVPGYALLGEFLERGLAVSVSEFERLADRHQNLVERIRDHLLKLRAEFSALQSDKQTRLLGSADVLVFVAALYYLISLLPGLSGHKDPYKGKNYPVSTVASTDDVNWLNHFAPYLACLIALVIWKNWREIRDEFPTSAQRGRTMLRRWIRREPPEN